MHGYVCVDHAGFCNLHWLLVKQSIIYQLLLLTYKTLNSVVTKWIYDYISLYVPKRILLVSTV